MRRRPDLDDTDEPRFDAGPMPTCAAGRPTADPCANCERVTVYNAAVDDYWKVGSAWWFATGVSLEDQPDAVYCWAEG